MSSSKIPDPIITGSERAWSLDYLYHQWKMSDANSSSNMMYPGQKTLCGFAIPPFQRPLVWSDEQKIKFIENMIYGIHIGHFVYNNAQNEDLFEVDGAVYFHKTDRWIIDGQQRMNALSEYWEGKISAFGHKWSDLNNSEQYRILHTPFHAKEVHLTDENMLRKLYDIMNFSGTPHTQDQRAISD